MASSGSFGTGSYSDRYLIFNWWIIERNINGNYTKIGWNYVGAGGSTSNYLKMYNGYLNINGNRVWTESGSINLYNGTTVASGETIIYHDSSGNASFSADGGAGIYTYAINCTGSNSWSLDNIPRASYITGFGGDDIDGNFNVTYGTYSSFTNKLRISIPNVVSLQTKDYASNTQFKLDSSTIDYLRNYLGNNTAVTLGAVIETWNGNTKIGESSELTHTVYLKKHTISNSSVNISNSSSLSITTNSNGTTGSCKILLQTLKDNVYTTRYTKSGSNVSFSVEEINSLLQYFANNPNFNIRIVAITTLNNIETYYDYKTGVYSIINSTPIFSDFEYEDSDTLISSITENNQLIVKNKSNLRIKISSLNKMSARNSSTPVRYDITAGNRSGSLTYSDSDSYIDLGTINTSGTITINVNAVDSRGFKTLVSKNINIIDYAEPTVNTILGRINNFEANTSILTSGTYANVNNKNNITGIYYRYKLKSLANWDNISWIPFNITQASGEYSTDTKNVVIDNQDSFDFQVKVIDKINFNGIILDYEIDEGVPVQFINATRKNVGIGCLNETGEEYSLEVKSKIYAENGKKVLVVGDTSLSKPIDSYPIGAIYQSTVSTSPATLFGGTWVQLKDNFLVGAGGTYANGSTGGASTVTLTVDHIPPHSHFDGGVFWQNGGFWVGTGNYTTLGFNGNTGNTGGGQAHENKPPYRAVYQWYRSA